MTEKTTAEETQGAEARVATDILATRLDRIEMDTEEAETDPTLAAEGLTEDELAAYVALLQDIRSRLGAVERDLTTALGKRVGKTVGALPDGRQFTVDRMADRKEWIHEDWKRDVRRKVADFYAKDCGLELVDGAGEVQPIAPLLQEVMAKVQEVHGSTAPRSRSLKELGLFATDYCTSTPGGWRFNAVKPTTKEDTTDD